MAETTHRNVIDLVAPPHACRHCGLLQLCDHGQVTTPAIEQLSAIVRHRVPLARGAALFHEGEPFRSIYVVFSGAMKTFTCSYDGDEQIVAFYLAGELVGVDGVHTGSHGSSAVALDRASVCEIPFEKLETLAQDIPGLLHQMLCMMSKEILQDEETMLLLGKKTADERLASLLLSLARRFREQGYSAQEFHLPMSRDDIANYLGLAHETVSRLFSRFQRQGLLTVRGKHVCVNNLAQLEILAGVPGAGAKTGRAGQII